MAGRKLRKVGSAWQASTPELQVKKLNHDEGDAKLEDPTLLKPFWKAEVRSLCFGTGENGSLGFRV